MNRRDVVGAILLAPAAALVGGCRSEDPWEGITDAEFAELEKHRHAGLELLRKPVSDTDAALQASGEFEAIAERRPALILGPFNAAVARLKAKDMDGAQRLARQAVSLTPQSSSARVLVALVQSASGQDNQVLSSLESAARVEPDNPMPLARLIRRMEIEETEPETTGNQRQSFTQLVQTMVAREAGGAAGGEAPAPKAPPLKSRDHDFYEKREKRLFPKRKRLVQLAYENAAARAEWMATLAERGHLTEAAAELEVALRLCPNLGRSALDLVPPLRDALATDAARSAVRVRRLMLALNRDPAYIKWSKALYGDPQDPTSLALRDWNPPPPSRFVAH